MASLKYIDISSSDSDDSGFQVEMDKYMYTDKCSRRRTASSINDGVAQSQATSSCPNSARSNPFNGHTLPPTLMPLNPGKYFSNPSNGRLLPLNLMLLPLMPPLIPGKHFTNPSDGRTLPPVLMTTPYVGFKDSSDQTRVGDISSSGSGDSDIWEDMRKDIEESSFGHTASSINDEIAQSKASSSCPNSARSNPSKVENCNMKSESRELPQIAKSDKYDGTVDDNKESKHERRDTNSEPKGNEKLDNDGYSGSNSLSNWKDVKEHHCLIQYLDIPGGNAETWQSSRGSLHGPANAGEESLYVDDKVFAEAREAVVENKIDAKEDDKLKDKDRKRKEGKHWDWGERDEQSFERTKEIIEETVQQWKKLKNGNEKKNVGKEDRESDKWGREKKEPQKEKEKINKKDVKELRSGSDKETPHIEKELVEIPGKSSEQENSTLEPKKKEHGKTREAVGENKIDAKRDDKLKDKDSKWKDGKHWDWGDRDKQSFDRTKEIIKEAIQQWKKLRNGNNINEKKNVGFDDGESEIWGCEKKESQKEKEKLNENVKELWSGSDKEAPHIEKEQVEIPGKSGEQENSTLEPKKKEHDKTREAVGENKIDAKGDDKLKDKDSKWKDGKHWDWGDRDKQSFDRTKEIIKEAIQQWKKLRNGNDINEKKNVGFEDGDSEKWGCEKKESQKEKEKLNENVMELWSGSDKEAPRIEKEQVEIPGKSSEQENSTLEPKKKEHDKTREAVGENKIDAKGDDKLKDKDSKWKDGKHWDWGDRDKIFLIELKK